MFGLSSSGKERIANIVEDMFDKIALQLLGNIPKLQNKKTLVISSERNYGLPELFVQSMANKMPNEIERDALKSYIDSAHGYIESLKNRTKSNIAERVDGLAREAKLRDQKASNKDIQNAINEEMAKAKSNLKAIAESESTKLRNLGTMMDISRVASSIGDEDPTVFFIVVRDAVTCKECLRLHIMPDGVTPRLWKFSELKQGYHKRGEDNASAFGLHPHCRCTLTYLSKGFGFDKTGKVKYHSEDYNAYKAQK